MYVSEAISVYIRASVSLPSRGSISLSEMEDQKEKLVSRAWCCVIKRRWDTKGSPGSDTNACLLNSRDVEKLCKICLMSLYLERLDICLSLFLLLQKYITMSRVQNSLGKPFLLSSCVGCGICECCCEYVEQVTGGSASHAPSTVCIVYASGDITEPCNLQQPRWWEYEFTVLVPLALLQNLCLEGLLRWLVRLLLLPLLISPPPSGGGY